MIKLLIAALLATGAVALYPPNSAVVELTPGNFDSLVTRGDEIWIVEFFAPWCGHCKNLVPEYVKAAAALKGVVKVGAVNADEHRDLGGRFDVRGFPAIKIFATDKRKPEEFNGARTAAGLIDAALAAVKAKVRGTGGGSGGGGGGGKDVVELTDANFDRLVTQSEDMWLVEFFAPWCGHCKSLEPHWAKAAAELKGKVKLGALDATVHSAKASQYGVQGYPTIKFFAPGKKSADSVADYDGGRTASDIVNWATDKLAENVPAPDVFEITDASVFKKACESRPLCVVALLPHLLDCQSDCRNNYVKVLKELGEKFKQKTWGWLWAEAGSQTALEESLDVGGFGYPAMAVINPRKMKYSVLRGSFSKDGINEFLRDLSYGRGNTSPVKGQVLPDIVQVAGWDGKDAELPLEEDIDLSDVDLDEKDEL